MRDPVIPAPLVPLELSLDRRLSDRAFAELSGAPELRGLVVPMAAIWEPDL